MSDPNMLDSEVELLAEIAADLKPDEADSEQWAGSPFDWLKLGIPSRTKGSIAEKVIARYFAKKGFDVVKSPDKQADRIIENVRVEIKFSTLWTDNEAYRFQQLRDQNYEVAICLGLSPFDAHCWVLPKEIVMRAWRKKWQGCGSQHGGAGGKDTAWLSVSPPEVHDWLVPYGGTLSQAVEVFRSFVTKSTKPKPAAPARR